MSKFSELIVEIDRRNEDDHEGDTCRLDVESNQVRVYYVYDTHDPKHRVPFDVYMKQIEACRNLCDLRTTYDYRNKNLRSDGEIYVITPTDDSSPRVRCFDIGLLLLQGDQRRAQQ